MPTRMPYKDKEKKREYNAAYRAANKEKVRATDAAYYAANREKVRAQQKEYHMGAYAAHLELYMWRRAKHRAKVKNIPFAITKNDIVIPPTCPVLGIPLQHGCGKTNPNSPSLDRIVPTSGYVPGNVVVVSRRANVIKNDATPDELALVTAFYQQIWNTSLEPKPCAPKAAIRPENRELYMWRAAKHRAKVKNIPFAITKNDIVIPPTCPVLGIPLQRGGCGKTNPNSPSLDRIVPARGYVPGNVVVVSHRANRIKNDATPDELALVTAFYQQIWNKSMEPQP